MNEKKEVPNEMLKELTAEVIATKLFLDLIIFLAILAVIPFIMVFLINNQSAILEKYPVIGNISNLPYDLFYIISGIASLAILYWNIKTKGSIKNFNDAILTIITSIAALKIFSSSGTEISQVVMNLTTNEGFLFFCKQLIVICGFAKVGISLVDFSKDRIKYYREKLNSRN